MGDLRGIAGREAPLGMLLGQMARGMRSLGFDRTAAKDVPSLPQKHGTRNSGFLELAAGWGVKEGWCRACGGVVCGFMM